MIAVSVVVMDLLAVNKHLMFYMIVMKILQDSNLMFQVVVLQVHLVVQLQQMDLQYLHHLLLY